MLKSLTVQQLKCYLILSCLFKQYLQEQYVLVHSCSHTSTSVLLIILLRNHIQSLHVKMIRPLKTLTSQGEWLTSLLPSNAFVTQKEWVTNIMCKPYSMKVKDFHNCIKSFNCFWPWCLMTTHILLLQILTSRLYCWCLCHYLGRILTCLKVHVHLMIFIKCFHTLSNPSALEIAKWLLKPSFLLPLYTVVRDSFHMVVLDVADLAIQHLAILVVARTPALIIKQILALIVFFGLSRPLSCSSYSHQLKH